MSRVQIRIVAGELRGRRLTCVVHEGLRPTPDRVREALFNILGNAIPDRPFYDVFAGTGVVGLEALSRGASATQFIERDFRQAQEIDGHLREFALADRGLVIRGDTYRWTGGWRPPAEPVNVFFSPPFADFEKRADELETALRGLQAKLAPGSVLVLQSERNAFADRLPEAEQWERRRYGRNELWIWVKEVPEATANGAAEHDRA